MQAETQTRMTILGRGSIRDKKKEEELRESGDPAHSHLNEDLHILVEVNGPFSEYKLRAGVAEVRKMLIPTVSSILLSLIEGNGNAYSSPILLSCNKQSQKLHTVCVFLASSCMFENVCSIFLGQNVPSIFCSNYRKRVCLIPWR